MILDEIIEKTKKNLKIKKIKTPLSLLEKKMALNEYLLKDVKKFLTSTKEEPIRIIAEIKKASPSKGIIKEDFDPLLIAKDYNKSGANAISVLTEPHYFKGDLTYLTQIRQETSVPLLRKDFIIDKYQIIEALVYKADFILLIAKALNTEKLKELYVYAVSLGLEVLVEVHDEVDLLKAIECEANIIGINHRDLNTFKMNMKLCDRLIPMIPKGKIVVAESGINNNEIIKKLSLMGVDAFLIGEHFMRVNSIEKELLSFKKSLL